MKIKLVKSAEILRLCENYSGENEALAFAKKQRRKLGDGFLCFRSAAKD
ncbi:hypothetical protein [Anaerobacterium chartisolvens]|nr:hypothetical protein [Anaerobacterium chartisolvens]